MKGKERYAWHLSMSWNGTGLNEERMREDKEWKGVDKLTTPKPSWH